MQQALFDPTDNPAVTVYTDGGCDPNPGPGGWAAILRFHEREVTIYGNARQTTNNQMELEAAVAALAYLDGRFGRCRVKLYTDSQYLRQGITSWIDDWFARGWLTKAGQPVKNQDLWRRLYRLTHAHEVQWRWVKGHAGNPDNERVDLLATDARARLTGRAVASSPSEITLSVAVSCRGSRGPGGWATIVCTPRDRQVLQGHESETTNNVLYLQAAERGLRALLTPSAVTVYAASDYLVRGAAEWVHGWQQRGWQTKSGQPVRNRAQWEALLCAAAPHSVTWQLVRGREADGDLAEAREIAGKII